LLLLDELVGRDRHRDFARLVFDEIGQRENADIDQAGENAGKDQESEQARHDLYPAAAKNGAIEGLRPGSLTTRKRGGQSHLSELLVYGTVKSRRKAIMVDTAVQKPAENALELALRTDIVRGLGSRSLVLVGMMGAGKSSIGRRLATRLALPFADADTEIETAVIARLLDHGPQVLATGGGAIMDQHTRHLIRIKGVSVWLKADLEVLSKRTKRRGDRPLIDKMKDLMPVREPVYALSDIVVQSRDEPHDTIVDEIVAALPKHLNVIVGEGTQP
jgi:shikimate kinase